MSARPVTPSHEAQPTLLPVDPSPSTKPQLSSSRPTSYLSSGAPAGSTGLDPAHAAPQDDSILSQPDQFNEEEPEESQRPGSSGVEGGAAPDLIRSESQMSQSQTQVQSRGGTLKKKASMKRIGSFKRSNSKRSSHAGSVKSMTLGEKEKYGDNEEMKSVFYTPIPTSGNPTELLSNRFQAWRKVLKDLINYFRDIQKSYDIRAKTLSSASNVIQNTTIPSAFVTSGGLGDAIHILRDFHKHALAEGNKARDIENEVIMQLTGLRSDLQQKIKEIKGLSGDFKSSVDKEQEGTKRAVRALQESLGMVDHDAAATSGKGDPFIVKMGVDRQVEKQIEEENYLHRAYLNLESSGRELESIVVGEIQKAYNAYAGILKREADDAFETAEKLREGPLSMAKDHEWDQFVSHSEQMVDPRVPVRSVGQITYPGKDHPAALEVKSGMLERKSKYLKNYTPGWYILSPTHLHEFKSADRIASQAPIMSLYLPEQKLGSHSEPSSSSHKFMLKGSQTGSMHRGHAWVFRAETHDTMMAWFGDIKELKEKTGEDRNAFVRRTHARSLSGNSLKAVSVGSSEGGMEEDEADRMPYSSEQSIRGNSVAAGAGTAAGATGAELAYDQDDQRSEAGWRPPSQRPKPGGRFPSEVNVDRGLQVPLSPSSGESSQGDRDVIAAAGALPGSGASPFTTHGNANAMEPAMGSGTEEAGVDGNITPVPHRYANHVPGLGGFDAQQQHGGDGGHEGEWLAPGAAGVGGAAIGAGAIHHYTQQHNQLQPEPAVPAADHAAEAPIPVAITTASSDSPANTQVGTGSSLGDTGTLSTVPTSTESQTQPPMQNQSYFDKNGVWEATHTNVDSATGEVITPQIAKVEALGMRPLHMAQSSTTISDLHIPGEFPRPPDALKAGD